MNKTIFDVDDIGALRAELEAEYSQMSPDAARAFQTQRANEEWNEIARIRRIINDWYKCPNVLSPQPDRLPAMKCAGGAMA